MQKYSFFNSINGDRIYSASDFAEYYSKVLTSGIMPQNSTNLQVMGNNTYNVTVEIGDAIINGHLFQNTTPHTFQIQVADSVLHRIDLVCLQLDTQQRKIELVLKEGTPSNQPIAPETIQTAAIYELALAEININAATPSIQQQHILDTRLSDRCGVVTSLIDVDTSTIFNDYKNWYETKTAQYQKDFEDWFKDIQLDASNHSHPIYDDQLGEQSIRMDNLESRTRINWRNLAQSGASTNMEDVSSFIQQELYFLKAEGGGTLYVPRGVWKMQSTVKIPSNVTIKSDKNAIFIRNAEINALFINDSDGTIGGYGANENITIEGGIFDGNTANFTALMTLVAFKHAKNIKILGSEFRNITDWHFNEISACRDVKIFDSKYTGYRQASSPSEAIQIDLALSSGTFPWFGPFDANGKGDNTCCLNVTIDNCTFEDVYDGIGTHSSHSNYTHRNVKVTNCTFENTRGIAVKGLNWNEFLIQGNHMYSVGQGIVMTPAVTIKGNFVIDGNIIRKANVIATGRGINIVGSASAFYENGVISNNQVYECGSHGITANFMKFLDMIGNGAHSNGQCGFWLYGTKNSSITGCNAFGNDTQGTNIRYDMMIGHTGALDTYRPIITGCNVGKLNLKDTNDALISNTAATSGLTNTGTATKISNSWNGTTFISTTA
ncbi:right-handed parallel beta-helix repeat-containing protein [Peribacillus frigoritolerans]|uniref:right-handed parallel beta-helix repeat-containing protein n=1 Tax=Peribacillus frigoritolerans TaxID=450367 RepID=UPI00207A35A2|nr:right-handed parallel beta-helix repeat-containing protein [Peribacillus frigoritolerans]USK78953.1 right-handed parallel beta-helix repeat-containing protein [Peribacillus frigoritolerans]